MTESTTSEHEIQYILEERARKLARPLTAAKSLDNLEVVVFQLGQERYALEAKSVREVFRLQVRSALPGAPDPIAGVTAHRGELLTLLDLRSTLGLPTGALNDLGRVMVLEEGGTRLGLLVDRVDRLETIERTQLRPAAPSGPAPRDLLLGTTAEALLVLETEGLLRLFDGRGDS